MALALALSKLRVGRRTKNRGEDLSPLAMNVFDEVIWQSGLGMAALALVDLSSLHPGVRGKPTGRVAHLLAHVLVKLRLVLLHKAKGRVLHSDRDGVFGRLQAHEGGDAANHNVDL